MENAPEDTTGWERWSIEWGVRPVGIGISVEQEGQGDEVSGTGAEQDGHGLVGVEVVFVVEGEVYARRAVGDTTARMGRRLGPGIDDLVIPDRVRLGSFLPRAAIV